LRKITRAAIRVVWIVLAFAEAKQDANTLEIERKSKCGHLITTILGTCIASFDGRLHERFDLL
jgi:hypothetical protein